MKTNIMRRNSAGIVTFATALAVFLGFSACSEQSTLEATQHGISLNKRPVATLTSESAATSETL